MGLLRLPPLGSIFISSNISLLAASAPASILSALPVITTPDWTMACMMIPLITCLCIILISSHSLTPMAAAMTTIDTIHIPSSQITAGTIHLAAIMIGPSRRLLRCRKVTIRLCPMILVITAVAGPTKSTRQPGYWTAALARMRCSANVLALIGLSLLSMLVLHGRP